MKIQLSNIFKIFSNNHKALKNINLKFDKKEITTILGRSGSGKSTLLRIINLLEKPSKGKIFFDNEEIIQNKPNNSYLKIGMVFQQFNLFPHFTVEKNLTYALMKYSTELSFDVIKERAKILLKKFNIEDKIHSYPKDLSGGEKQRAAICRALMLQPKFMTFDEPTSALDVENTNDVIKIIRELKKEMNILLITHNIKFAQIVSSRVLFMDKGEILEDTKSSQFFSSPNSHRGKIFLKNIENLIF
ncbi:MAG: amino acid ABC transporter ATP-binding protein [Rickettsia sp.]|nr:amino acid ABC transporter ATP-binding protein [Rickettsia sp.]